VHKLDRLLCGGGAAARVASRFPRNLLIDLDDCGRQPRFLIHDRDAKFSRAFDAICQGEGIRVIRTPVRAPNANAHIERWVGSLRRECLDRLLIFNRRQLEHVLRAYVRHYNTQRPIERLTCARPTDPFKPHQQFHRADRQRRRSVAETCSVASSTNTRPSLHEPKLMHPTGRIRRRDVLGGLIHEYKAAA
jgi:hypothetical protein